MTHQQKLSSMLVLAMMITAIGFVQGDQQVILSTEDLLKAPFVAVVEIKKTTKVEVPIGSEDRRFICDVFVAEADAIEVIKSDTQNRSIAIVGSKIRTRKSHLRPIVNGRYLVFLHRNQSFYTYAYSCQLRPISTDGKDHYTKVNKKDKKTPL